MGQRLLCRHSDMLMIFIIGLCLGNVLPSIFTISRPNIVSQSFGYSKDLLLILSVRYGLAQRRNRYFNAAFKASVCMRSR